MLSNAYFLAKFRFDTAENEPAKNLQNFAKFKQPEVALVRALCQRAQREEASSSQVRSAAAAPLPAASPKSFFGEDRQCLGIPANVGDLHFCVEFASDFHNFLSGTL